MKTIAIDTEYEIWKPIFNYDGYEVSSIGRIRNKLSTRGRIKELHFLKPYKNEWGRLQVDLYKKFVRRKAAVHTLVLETFFIGPLLLKVECAHINGKEWDNKFVNLKWATHKENESHKRVHGTMKLGEQRFGAKLTNDDVISIRKLYIQGICQKELAKRFGVCNTIISRVVNRKIWSHI